MSEQKPREWEIQHIWQGGLMTEPMREIFKGTSVVVSKDDYDALLAQAEALATSLEDLSDSVLSDFGMTTGVEFELGDSSAIGEALKAVSDYRAFREGK